MPKNHNSCWISLIRILNLMSTHISPETWSMKAVFLTRPKPCTQTLPEQTFWIKAVIRLTIVVRERREWVRLAPMTRSSLINLLSQWAVRQECSSNLLWLTSILTWVLMRPSTSTLVAEGRELKDFHRKGWLKPWVDRILNKNSRVGDNKQIHNLLEPVIRIVKKSVNWDWRPHPLRKLRKPRIRSQIHHESIIIRSSFPLCQQIISCQRVSDQIACARGFHNNNLQILVSRLAVEILGQTLS